MRHLVLGTAGHIDHGKTTLVRVLTGVDTDRLPEEKKRGITIDLGFARLPLEDVEFGVVDVPGHESLVRNMLAGATGIDVVLLVVAADEGVMPQTREHLSIMHLLDVRRAVVAITKSDLVEADWLELVREDVRGELARAGYGDAPLVPVSATAGAGLDALCDALRAAAAESPVRDTDDLFRLPVDRVFTVRGTGTVVTGSIWSGRVSRDAALRVLPGGAAVRARGLQRHGSSAESAGAGERVALALACDRSAVERGDTLTDHPHWQPGTTLTVRLHVLADAPPVRTRQRVRLHLGTREVLARVAVPGGGDVAPGADAWVQLRLETPLLARAGDHFVLRSYSPVHTIAGGITAEPDAPRRKHVDGVTREALEAIVARSPAALAAAVTLAGPAGALRSLLPILTGMRADEVEAGLPRDEGVYAAGDRVFTAAAAADVRREIRDALARAHREAPLEPGLSREELRRASRQPPLLVDAVIRELTEAGEIAARGAAFALPGFEPKMEVHQARLAEALASHLFLAGLSAPRLQELPEDIRVAPDLPRVAQLLVQQGRLVALAHDHFADAGAVLTAESKLRAQLPEHQPLMTGTLKEVVGVSRKYLIPLLEYFDRVGVTRRVGESRMLLPGRRDV